MEEFKFKIDDVITHTFKKGEFVIIGFARFKGQGDRYLCQLAEGFEIDLDFTKCNWFETKEMILVL